MTYPGHKVEHRVFAGFGTPTAGLHLELMLVRLFITTRGPGHVGAIDTIWHFPGHGYDRSRRVIALIERDADVEIAISLDELRHSFRPVTRAEG